MEEHHPHKAPFRSPFTAKTYPHMLLGETTYNTGRREDALLKKYFTLNEVMEEKQLDGIVNTVLPCLRKEIIWYIE
jgi:hypothetical protein